MSAAERLAALGITLPAPVPPLASYVPAVQAGALLFVSGQLPMQDGRLICKGHLGADVSIDQGKLAARQCFINILAQIAAATGSLDRVARIVRLGGFIAATASFTDHAAVMNGASDLAAEVFGDAGRHTRSTIGVPSLPLGAAVEVEALVALH